MKIRSSDVLILGAGPAGLRAGLKCLGKRKVTFLDKDGFGKRILVSGNGRANFFNELLLKEETYAFYPFQDVKDIVFSSGENKAQEFFSYLTKQLGFAYRKEGNLCYPFFNRSECLNNFLKEELNNLHAEFLKGQAKEIKKNSLIYLDENGEENQIQFQDLVLALGGESYDRKERGNDSLLSYFQIKKTPYQSCLCPIVVQEKIPPYLKNQRLKGTLSIYYRNQQIYSETGEILFKKDGLSGICVFNASLYLRQALKEAKWKDRKRKIDYYPEEYDNLPRSCYPTFLISYLKEIKSDFGKPLVFHPSGFYPLKESQASFGGISLSEVNHSNRQRIKYPHIYRLGERLSPCFPCGGFNRGISFIEGYIAGKALANETELSGKN